MNEDSAPLTEISNPNWNVNVITSQNGIRRYPVVYDLDVAEMVTGIQSTDFAMPPGFGDVPTGLQAEQVVRTADIDEDGRAIALRRLETFFAGIEIVLRFKVVGDANVRFYKDPAKKNDKLKPNPVDESPETLRVGTPISVIGPEGDMLKVAIISSGVRDLVRGEDDIGYIDAQSVILDELPIELLKKVDLRDYAF